MLKVPTMLRPPTTRFVSVSIKLKLLLHHNQRPITIISTIIAIISPTISTIIIATIRQHIFSPPTTSTDPPTTLQCALNTRLSSRFHLHHFHHHHHHKHVKCRRCGRRVKIAVHFNIVSKLPQSKCLVLAIHSYIDPLTSLTESPRAAGYSNIYRDGHL